MDDTRYARIPAAAWIKRQPDVSLLAVPDKGGYVYAGMNDEAWEIISRCDGSRTVRDIIDELLQVYHDDPNRVGGFVRSFIDRLMSIGALDLLVEPEYAMPRVLGSREMMTPEYAILELTYRCPLSCRHCFLSAGHGSSMKSEELFVLAADLVDRVGIRGVQLTGGEPFVHPDVLELVEFFVENRVAVTITTSGMIDTEATRKCIRRIGGAKGSLQVSVDGLRESHNRIRGNGNSFSKAVSTISYSVAQKVPVAVAVSLLDQSEQEIKDLAIVMREIGVHRFRLGAVSMQGRALSISNEGRWDFNAVHCLIAELKKELQTDHFRIGNLEEQFSGGVDGPICGAGTKIICINPDLDVKPCPMLQRFIGNLRTQGWKEILLEGNRIFRGTEPPNSVECSECTFKDRCSGCYAEGLVNSARVSHCPWLSERPELTLWSKNASHHGQ